MRAAIIGSVAILVTGLMAGSVFGATLRKDDGPAEFPPASYTANQYVDSKGCVYIRAGYAGQVQWIPRVSRGRDVVCGFQPSLASTGQPVATAKADPVPAPKPIIKPLSQPAPVAMPEPDMAPVGVAKVTAPRPDYSPASPIAPATLSAPNVIASQDVPAMRVVPYGTCGDRTVVSASYMDDGRIKVRCSSAFSLFGGTSPYSNPAPAPSLDTFPQFNGGSQGEVWTFYPPPLAGTDILKTPAQTKTTARPKTVAPYAPVAPVGNPSCQGASELSTRYINNGGKYPVRCGPQQADPYTAPQDYGFKTTIGQPNLVPASVNGEKVLSVTVSIGKDMTRTPLPTPPAGYKLAWDDDRLNPDRGPRSLQGEVRTNMIWSQTVPRELIAAPAQVAGYQYVYSTKSVQ